MTNNTQAALATDTSIATDKNTTVTTDSSTTSMNPVAPDDERSLEADDLVQETGDDFPDIPDFTPPLRIHASRVPERLTGSYSTLEIPPEVSRKMRRRKSDPATSGLRSGSRSPTGMYDGGSSISSLEDAGFDTDLLTDKMGTLELDLKKQQDMSHSLNRSLSNLPPVTERLSEETLEDCHAFTDIKREDGYHSRGNSIATGGEASSSMLEPLDEGDEEDEGEGGVKITNMEEILEVAEEEAAETTSSLLTR
jgi:hypothetical protein